MNTQEQRERFEAAQRPRTDLAKNRRGDYTNPVVQHCWRTWQAAEAAAIERCAELIDGMNDSSGDRASYDNREMHEGEVERMNALSDAAKSLRALLPKEE